MSNMCTVNLETLLVQKEDSNNNRNEEVNGEIKEDRKQENRTSVNRDFHVTSVRSLKDTGDLLLSVEKKGCGKIIVKI